MSFTTNLISNKNRIKTYLYQKKLFLFVTCNALQGGGNYLFQLQSCFIYCWKALKKCNLMMLFALSYFDTGCLKKVKTGPQTVIHITQQPDQILKKAPSFCHCLGVSKIILAPCFIYSAIYSWCRFRAFFGKIVFCI